MSASLVGSEMCIRDSLHSRGVRPQILKQGYVPILVFHPVTLEHHSPFILARRVVWSQFTVLLNCDAEQAPKVGFLSRTPGLSSNIIPVTDQIRVLFPAFAFTSSVPFSHDGSPRLRFLMQLLLSDRSGDQRINRRASCDLLPMTRSAAFYRGHREFMA